MRKLIFILATLFTASIAPRPLPVAILSQSAITVYAGESFVLDATGSTGIDATFNDSRCIWNTDDGLAAVHLLRFSHLYPTPGVYHPTVTVSDGAGHTSSATETVTVLEFPTAVVSRTATTTDAQSELNALITTMGASDVTGELILQAGTNYPGTLTLPARPGHTKYITIRSSASASLPARGNRVRTSDLTSNMAHVVAPDVGNAPGVVTAAGAAFYRLIGLDIQSPATHQGYAALKFEAAAGQWTSLADRPHHLVVDRCIVRNAHTDTAELQFNVIANSASTTFIGVQATGARMTGIESTAFKTWNGASNQVYYNVYSDCPSVGSMMGGAGGGVEIVQDAISFRRVYYTKNFALASGPYVGKNLWEAKNCQWCLVDSCLFEVNYLQGQQGYAILFTSRPSSDGAAAVVEDIQFSNNIVRQTGAGVQIAGVDDFADVSKRDIRAQRIIVKNVLFQVDNATYPGQGFGLKTTGVNDLWWRHNTMVQAANITDFTLPITGVTSARLTMNDNVMERDAATGGVFGDSAGEGTVALNAYFSPYSFLNNLIPVISLGPYPPTTLTAPSFSGSFVDYAAGNFTLVPSSPGHNAATDGTDCGVSMPALQTALGASTLNFNTATFDVVTGQWGSLPAPPPSPAIRCWYLPCSR